MKAKQRIRKEIEKWFITEPLFFSVWLTHKLKENPNTLNIRVGNGIVEYNPDFILSLSNKMLSEVLMAEAMRIVLKHPYLRKKENPCITYQASNITLREYLSISLDFPTASEIFHTEDLNKQYFELYYQKLIEQDQQCESNNQSKEDSLETNKEKNILEQYTDELMSGIENTQLWDRDEFQTISINDKIRIAKETDSWGNIAGNMVEMILATLIPELNYKKILRHFRASIISNRRILTRMKPSRRYGFQFMGSKYDFSTRLLFAVDVSASMTSKELQKGFSIINQIFKYGIEKVDVIQFDTQINDKVMTMKKARRKVKAHGRGGTDFNNVIEYINTNKYYDGLIIYTDGYAPCPKSPINRRTKIVWLFNDKLNYEKLKDSLVHLGKVAYVN
ncbi:hypothetical protein MHK_002117 [Candidatus Magnetomorum sp. HK-1]|nr:hypothetical protein MHK_002117 [Candidatus Magnetomorum sp. HK-1]